MRWITGYAEIGRPTPLETAISDEKSERYRQKRGALTARLLDFLLTARGQDASFRSLAAAAGVTRPTLVHYFGDHQGVLCAALRLAAERGRVHTERLAAAQHQPPADLLPALFHAVAAAWDEELGRLHRVGMRMGLADAAVGAIYHDHVIAPSYAAFAKLLRGYHQRGALCVPDPDAAAVSLYAPVVMFLIAQHQLADSAPDPEQTAAFIDAHVRLFLRGCAP